MNPSSSILPAPGAWLTSPGAASILRHHASGRSTDAEPVLSHLVCRAGRLPAVLQSLPGIPGFLRGADRNPDPPSSPGECCGPDAGWSPGRPAGSAAGADRRIEPFGSRDVLSRSRCPHLRGDGGRHRRLRHAAGAGAAARGGVCHGDLGGGRAALWPDARLGIAGLHRDGPRNRALGRPAGGAGRGAPGHPAPGAERPVVAPDSPGKDRRDGAGRALDPRPLREAAAGDAVPSGVHRVAGVTRALLRVLQHSSRDPDIGRRRSDFSGASRSAARSSRCSRCPGS